MMQQYLQVKKQYADCLLWFRLGDFYEMFLDDAKIGSRVLGIVLTSRARGKDGKIPMCGIPYHAADAYLSKLIKAGHKVAICEQLTQPDGKNLVKREVIRIVTPGTVLDEKSLERKQHNYIVSLCLENDSGDKVLGIAATDLSTGDLQANQFKLTDERTIDHVLGQVFTQFQPTECIFPPSQHEFFSALKELKRATNLALFSFQEWSAWAKKPEQTIQTYFKLSGKEKSLISKLPIAEQVTAGLLGYLQHTQKTVVSHLHTIQLLLADDYLKMDRSTMDNLELFRPLSDRQRAGSLLDVIDHTRTAMGGRLLRHWLLQPLVIQRSIEDRLDAVEFFLKNGGLRADIIDYLAELNDIERIISRLSVKLGNPKDIKSLEESLAIGVKISERLIEFSSEKLPSFLRKLAEEIKPDLLSLIAHLHNTIVATPPFDPKNGYLVQDGIDPELDELRTVVAGSRDLIAKLEVHEKQRSGISSLKIKFNQVFGFYIEISNSNLKNVPEDYMRKQTLVNAERFITPELKKHEQIILKAEERMNQIEYDLFLKLVDKILSEVKNVQSTAAALAQIDCVVGFAELAENQNYCKPQLTDNGEIVLVASRHPVVEQLVESHRFVPNDISLNNSDKQLLLLTGPNMAGKSVLMRQVTLIVLLAHIGSFVPAKSRKNKFN